MTLKLIKRMSAGFIGLLLMSNCSDDGQPAATLPEVQTQAPSAIAQTTVTSGGNVLTDGRSTITERGVCWATNPNPTIADSNTKEGTGSGTFTSQLTGLQPATSYFIRAYATNAAGTAYGNELSFTTLPANTVPELTTAAVTSITILGATSGGTVVSDGGAAISKRGVCWSTSQNPTIDNANAEADTDNETFTAMLSNLQPNTQYFLRAFATNSVGTGYGNEISFSTLDGVADIDGNIYNRVTIGTQVWLQENLKTKRYRNGDEIATTDPPTRPVADEVGAKYYWSYNASESNEDAYGLLYTYSTVTDARGLCPAGWHVPTINEFETMIIALGGSAVAGGKLKATGTEFWNEPNTGATNESGFTALPGGFKNAFGPFNSLKEFGWFWTTTETSATNATAFRLDNQSTEVAQGSALKNAGFSVRCVKD